MAPDFEVPDPYVDGVSVVEYDERKVTMPLWFWKKVVAYIASIRIWYLEETISK